MKILFFVSLVKTQFAACRDELAGHHKITGRFDSICKNRFSVFEQKQIFFFSFLPINSLFSFQANVQMRRHYWVVVIHEMKKERQKETLLK